jgi:hypothetical protein
VKPVTLAVDLEELAIVHEAIEKGRDRRLVAEQLRPIFEPSI